MSFIPLPCAIPQRLSKLYSDTKQSYDVVAGPEKSTTFTESAPLQRKFKIQRERLIAWGYDWNDGGAASQDDIDDSIARAGLTDTVTSLLGTIGEILQEAEGFQRGPSPIKGANIDKTPDIRSWTAANQAKYEDLVKDLTASIDVLYKLSDSRQSLRRDQKPKATISALPPRASTSLFQKAYSASEVTLVNPQLPNISLRTGLPPKIDVSILSLPREDPPPYDSDGEPLPSRIIGRLSQSYSSTNPWKTSAGKNVQLPVLIEYANFDSAYSDTGVSPPMERLEQLLAILVKCQADSASPSTLPCLGYFEDPNHPRVGIVYELPLKLTTGRAENESHDAFLKPYSLHDLLKSSSTSSRDRPVQAPPLEQRYRLALRLVQTFSKIHGSNFEHREVKSRSIMLFREPLPPGRAPGRGAGDFDVRHPFITSFDVFSEYDIVAKSHHKKLDMYKHPLDPRLRPDYHAYSGTTQDHAVAPQFEMYSLALVLTEIGLWTALREVWKPKYNLQDFKTRLENIWIPRLYARCGTAYATAVKECFALADRIAEGYGQVTNIQQTYNRAMIHLQKCCLLDENDSSDESPVPAMLVPQIASNQQAQPKRQRSTAQLDSDSGSLPSHILKRMSLEKGAQRRQNLLSAPALHALQTAPTLIDESNWESSRTMLSPSRDSLFERSSMYKEKAFTAASTIQRAWRSRSEKKPSFREYKHKVTLIQKQWRRRLATKIDDTPRSQRSQNYQNTYPTPEPEVSVRTVSNMEQEMHLTAQMSWTTTYSEKPARPKLVVHAVQFSDEVIAEWHQRLLPRLEKYVTWALKDSEETMSIDLMAVGPTPATARPTMFVTCTSTGKVKAVLSKKFTYDAEVFDLKVRKGRIRRSKLASKPRRRGARRSMNTATEETASTELNARHQQRPSCGASIGCWDGNQHYPAVTFGGVVLVDDEPYGMTVHHGLDAPSDDESDEDDFSEDDEPGDAFRASAPATQTMNAMHTTGTSPLPAHSFELTDDDYSDDDTGYDSSEIDDLSNFDDDEDYESDAVSDASTAGDVDGWGIGDGGDELHITQPAFDDVEDEFFPSPEDAPEEHLSSHSLGYVHASSGIRRWRKDGIVHEIDWALLKIDDSRLPAHNVVQGGKQFAKAKNGRTATLDEDEFPHDIASGDLGNMNVHCYGNSSGLSSGMISGAMSSVRIHRRQSPSRSWTVMGGLGVPGDSGAWVIENHTSRVCGHVLAWSERMQVAYICPMQVLIDDMKRTLGAAKISLPSAERAERATHAKESPCAAKEELFGPKDSKRGLLEDSKVFEETFSMPRLQDLHLGEGKGVKMQPPPPPPPRRSVGRGGGERVVVR